MIDQALIEEAKAYAWSQVAEHRSHIEAIANGGIHTDEDKERARQCCSFALAVISESIAQEIARVSPGVVARPIEPDKYPPMPRITTPETEEVAALGGLLDAMGESIRRSDAEDRATESHEDNALVGTLIAVGIIAVIAAVACLVAAG